MTRSVRLLITSLTLSLLPPSTGVCAGPQAQQVSPRASFDASATEALLAMRARAEELKVGGVAMVAYMPGDTLQSWSSRVEVVGRYKDPATATDKGNNLLGIVYAKAAEMADTLKDSGSQSRATMTGELGWQGGVIARGKAGYLIAASSGGKSEDDVQVSRAGLAVLKQGL